MSDKFILDPCCGPKHMWVNKNHPYTIYGDIRREKKGFVPSKSDRTAQIKPDMIMDFRNIPFPDKSFKLVVFDPPHFVTSKMNRYTHIKYGILSPLTWRKDLKKGFNECWRVLDDFGTLILKWSEVSRSYREVLKVLGKQPLFHYIDGGKKKATYWACFMKLPEKYILQETLV